MNEELTREMEKMEAIHTETSRLFEASNVTGPLLNEYKRGVEQYESMYQSIENMKMLTSKEDSVKGLINQQLKILQNRSDFEMSIRDKL